MKIIAVNTAGSFLHIKVNLFILELDLETKEIETFVLQTVQYSETICGKMREQYQNFLSHLF